MRERRVAAMKTYWERAAQTNAAWYVDTSLNFNNPDMDTFFETGERVVRMAFDEAPVKPERTEHAVEIGSGLGRICAALARRFDRVTGVDISSEMVNRARDLVPDESVQFSVTDGASIGVVGDSSTDLVVTFTVFQHITATDIIEAYVAEAGRILRPGGVFFLQWNSASGPLRWRARRALLSTLQRTGLKPVPHGTNATEFLGSTLPVARMRRALGAAGLDLVATRGEGTLYSFGWARKL